MTREEFYEFVKVKTSELLTLLEKKAKEYAQSNQAFYNFDEGLGISTCKSREEYAWNLRVKHLQSIKDILEGKQPATQELINEKFGDDLGYNLLIWAMLTENLNENNEIDVNTILNRRSFNELKKILSFYSSELGEAITFEEMVDYYSKPNKIELLYSNLKFFENWWKVNYKKYI